MEKATLHVFDGPNRGFRLRERDLPADLGKGEILVRIRLATLGENDRLAASGQLTGPSPSVLGQEGVGEVIRSARTGVEPGQRVVWSAIDSCGECPACTRFGLPQKCARAFRYGFSSIHDGCGLNGSFSTHLLLRGGTSVVPVPEAMADAVAAPANGPWATAVQALRGLRRPERALVQGCGLPGLAAIARLRQAGCAQIFAMDAEPGRRARAREFGAIPTERPLPAGSVEVAVETCGDPEALAIGLAALSPGGTYLWLGLTPSNAEATIPWDLAIRKCLAVRGTHLSGPADLAAAVRLLSSLHLRLPLAAMVAPPRALAHLPSALSEGAAGRWLRTSIDPRLRS